MKQLSKYLAEKLIINKDYRDNTIVVKSFVELRKIINDRYDKLGPGTEQNPIDFNDIDVSNIDSFCKNKVGIFERTKFEYIDISEWDVSEVTDMTYMFYKCDKLKSVGDISSWNVSNVTDMAFMFYDCKNFNQDISGFDISNVKNISGMFNNCIIKKEYKPKYNY